MNLDVRSSEGDELSQFAFGAVGGIVGRVKEGFFEGGGGGVVGIGRRADGAGGAGGAAGWSGGLAEDASRGAGGARERWLDISL